MDQFSRPAKSPIGIEILNASSGTHPKVLPSEDAKKITMVAVRKMGNDMTSKIPLGVKIIAGFYILICISLIADLALKPSLKGIPWGRYFLISYVLACVIGLLSMKQWGRMLVIFSLFFIILILITAMGMGISAGKIMIIMPMFFPLLIPIGILIIFLVPKLKIDFLTTCNWRFY